MTGPKPYDFFHMILTTICKHHDAIDMQVEEDENTIRIHVKVDPEDMRYVIGRKGKTINSLRQCTRIMGGKSEKRIYFNLIEN